MENSASLSGSIGESTICAQVARASAFGGRVASALCASTDLADAVLASAFAQRQARGGGVRHDVAANRLCAKASPDQDCREQTRILPAGSP